MAPAPPCVVLRARKARPFFARHPWVFAGSIARVQGNPSPGAEVEVVSHEGQFVARGLFNPDSAIRVRLYRWNEGPLDTEFWCDRIDAALRLRRDILNLDTPGASCRLIFSEADGLSGMTVDRYDRWLVVQFTSRALHERREVLIDALVGRTKAEGVILRTDRAIAAQEGLALTEGPCRGEVPDGPIVISQHGLSWEVDLISGQKTGFYLDQRDNRMAAALYARGRRVLDLCCHSGGFSLCALQHGGATHALGIDSSEPAIATARRNAVANGLGAARFEAVDVFAALERLRERGDRFGLVVCDPPKFAPRSSGVDAALRAYLRLNRASLQVLEPDGVLVTCSCSGLISTSDFDAMLSQVAELSGRSIQFLERRGQAADHPISASCPESEYLKCMICRVD